MGLINLFILPLSNTDMIVGLTGPNCAGKGETAKYLQKKGFRYFSLSDEIRSELDKRGLEHTREHMIAAGNELRSKEGHGVFALRVLRRLPKDHDIVIDSIRNPIEIETLRQHPLFVLWGINAPVEIRFERAMKRGRTENASTLEEFKAIEEKENSGEAHKQQLKRCYKMADKRIQNDGTFVQLYMQIDKLLKQDHFSAL